MVRIRGVLAGVAAVVLAVGLPATARAGAGDASPASLSTTARSLPTEFPLPNGFRPEAMAVIGHHGFIGGNPDGAIYRVDLRTGQGARLAPGPGTSALAVRADSRGRLFVTGGRNGDARVVDSRTGAILASYSLGTPGATLVNDAVVTERAVYMTESLQPVLYKLPLGRDGALPTQAQVVRIPLTGDMVFGAEGLNSNGIIVSSDRRTLLMAQTNAGKIFRVDPRTGVTTQLDLGGEILEWADGLLLLGRTLRVVQNRSNMVAVIELNRAGTAGRVVRKITDPRFDVPTTMAVFRDRIYLPNARLTTPLTPETTYNVVSIPIR